MATTSLAQERVLTHAEHTPAHHAVDKLSLHRLGLWLFILSESFLFMALITTRYYLQGMHRPEELNQALGLLITGVLLLSSLTAYRAEAAAAHGDARRHRRNLWYTVGLGLLFMVGVGIEWREAFHHFPPSTGFGTVFFTTTGIHAFHVLSGIILLVFIGVLGRDGRYTKGHHWPVEGSVKYWHFVDLAWVFIYPTLYLVS